MQVKEKSGTITEPVTVSEAKDYCGYTASDQDNIFTEMITAAREWIEDHCAFSCVSKSYIVRFQKNDAVDDWYELPMSPVISITTVSIDTEEVEYVEKGDEVRYVQPDEVISTGTSGNELVVEFVAGIDNKRAVTAIKRVVSDMFNNKDDHPTDVNVASLSYDTLRFVEGLNRNTGL